MPKLIDLTGQKFNRLTVLNRAENKNGRVAWNCQCDCGNKIIVTSKHLRDNHTQSCGCLRKERAGKRRGQFGQCGNQGEYQGPGSVTDTYCFLCILFR